jgi:hypothetical protein
MEPILFESMAQVKTSKATKKGAQAAKSLPTFWELEATEAIRALMRRRRIKFKQLSRLLAGYEIDVPPTTLSNKVNRGKFPFSFFVQCMYAMGLSDTRVTLSGMSDDELTAVRKAEKARRKRKFPEKVSTSGTTTTARKPPR